MTDDELYPRLRKAADLCREMLFTDTAEGCSRAAARIRAQAERIAELEGRLRELIAERSGMVKQETHAYAVRYAEAAERELAAVRELMNSHNLGGWTDAIGPMKRALAAERERDRLRELLTRARNPPKHHDCLPFSGNCEACILNYDIAAALAPESGEGK